MTDTNERNGPITFRAIIEDAGGGGAFVAVPFDVEKIFGKKRVKVAAVIGGVPYRGSIVRMGGDCHLLPVLKEIRRTLGKNIGDEIDVSVTEDVEPRRIAIPDDFMSALKESIPAKDFFMMLSYTHQREYVQWIEGAKRVQTRRARISRAIGMLNEGRKEAR